MAPRKQRHWAQWVWLAAGVGLAGRVAFIFLGQEAPPPSATAAERRPRVTVVAESGSASGPLVREQMELFDQQPLSMPTQWNAGYQPLPPDLQRQPGEIFDVYEPRWAFAAEHLEPVIGPQGGAPADGRGALRTIGPMAGGWAGLARRDRALTRLPEREAAIEVRPFAGGGEQIVLREALAGLPEAVREYDWAPVEFTVAVVPAGLVGVPTLTAGSGRDDIDAFFGGYLVRDFRLGARVAPGLYRVSVVR